MPICLRALIQRPVPCRRPDRIAGESDGADHETLQAFVGRCTTVFIYGMHLTVPQEGRHSGALVHNEAAGKLDAAPKGILAETQAAYPSCLLRVSLRDAVPFIRA